MRSTVSQLPHSVGSLKLSSKFNVLSAYEDFEMGKRATKTFEYLARHLGDEAQLKHVMWKFDVLAIPKLREIAVKDAADASILVVSSRNGTLPVEVKWWLEQSLSGDAKAVALVALADAPPEFDTVRAYLAELARDNGLDFFSQPEIASDFDGNLSMDRLHQAEKTSLTLPDPREASAHSHWGLNE